MDLSVAIEKYTQFQLTVNIKPRGMRNFASPIGCYTRIFAAIFDHNMTDIDMAYHITVNCYVLTDEKSTRERKTDIDIQMEWNNNKHENIFLVFGCTKGVLKARMNQDEWCATELTQSVTKQLDKCYHFGFYFSCTGQWFVCVWGGGGGNREYRRNESVVCIITILCELKMCSSLSLFFIVSIHKHFRKVLWLRARASVILSSSITRW